MSSTAMPGTAYDLTGRAAVVTGAASGIGQATAYLLARAGATVVCADINAAGARETAKTITEYGGDAEGVEVDVTEREHVASAIAGTVSAYGRLDIMANIAGVMHASTVLDTDDSELERVFLVDFMGVLHGSREAARVMVPRGSGCIINMASGAVDSGTPGLMAYSAAKAAVVQLTKTLAAEVGHKGIRVNAVAPGLVRTPMNAVFDDEKHTYAERVRRQTPLGRVGEPEDVAHAVFYLASDASSFVTGQILRPNGGLTMPW